MTYDTIDALRESLAQPTHKIRTPEYIAKMMHEIPKAESIEREKFILQRCKGKRVLEFGASGFLSTAIRDIAAEYCGVDRQTGDRVIGFDLDDVSYRSLPGSKEYNEGSAIHPDVIVCGEVLEHLANPGYFLQRLKMHFNGVPVIISVPNAFSEVGKIHLQDGIENVNSDHVSWYSPKTLKTLLERYGYEIDFFAWYGGPPLVAEGMVVVTK